MDREELAALVGAVQEIAAAVKRIEDRQDHMDGLLAKIVDRQARMESELQEFRKETREQMAKIGRRLDHHDHMLMDHDRRIGETEASANP